MKHTLVAVALTGLALALMAGFSVQNQVDTEVATLEREFRFVQYHPDPLAKREAVELLQLEVSRLSQRYPGNESLQRMETTVGHYAHALYRRYPRGFPG